MSRLQSRKGNKRSETAPGTVAGGGVIGPPSTREPGSRDSASSTNTKQAPPRSYDPLLSAAHCAFIDELRALVEQLPISLGDYVLDVPCGDGAYSALFASRCGPAGQIVAVDLDTTAVKAAHRRTRCLSPADNVIDIQSDVRAMPFEDASFDFAWCAQSVISLSRRGDSPLGRHTINALGEIRRVLRKGGCLDFLSTTKCTTFSYRGLLNWKSPFRMLNGNDLLTRYGNSQQLHAGRHLSQLLVRSGFKPLRRLTLVADRHGTPRAADSAFLTEYFRALRSQTRRELDRQQLCEFDRLADSDSPHSFFHDPHFEMTWLEFIHLGQKPATDGDLDCVDAAK